MEEKRGKRKEKELEERGREERGGETVVKRVSWESTSHLPNERGKSLAASGPPYSSGPRCPMTEVVIWASPAPSVVAGHGDGQRRRGLRAGRHGAVPAWHRPGEVAAGR